MDLSATQYSTFFEDPDEVTGSLFWVPYATLSCSSPVQRMQITGRECAHGHFLHTFRELRIPISGFPLCTLSALMGCLFRTSKICALVGYFIGTE